MKPYYQCDGVTLYLADSLTLLPEFLDEAFDVVLTDPPYNCGKQYGGHDDAMPPGDYRLWLARALGECRRLTRNGVVYFPGTSNVWDVREVLAGAGLLPHRMLAWHRVEYAGDKWAGGPATCWEPVVWAVKSVPAEFNRIYGKLGRDCLVVPSVRHDPLRKLHPCPKPLPVARWLVALFVPPGGCLLDPFAGTGTFLLAAKEAGARAVGVECEERYCELAARRLEQGVLDFGEGRG